MKSWQDKFTAHCEEAALALKIARLHFENGNSVLASDALRAAKREVNQASEINNRSGK